MTETETSTPGSARTRRTETSTYVLQVRQQTGEAVTWSDVATVEVPANTRRKTAIKKALEAWGSPIEGDGIAVRLLDGDSAEIVPVRPKPPEAPQLEIG